MNRRILLKGIAGSAFTFVLPGIVVPDKRFWALDQTMIPNHTHNHRQWLQWHLQSGIGLPHGPLHVFMPLSVDGQQKLILAPRSFRGGSEHRSLSVSG